MLILNRYLLGSFLKSFFSCLILFLFLYCIIDIFSNLGDIIKNHPPAIKVVELYLYSIPTILSQMAPVAALLATLFTLSSLNQNNEIIAMRASGLSIFEIVYPLIFSGLILSLALFLIAETIAPRAMRMSQMIEDQYIEKSPDALYEKSVRNVAVYGFNNRLFFINRLYPKTNTIEGLTILEHDADQNVRKKIYAQKAVWRENRWVLYQCFIYQLDDDRNIRGQPLYFNDRTFKIQETPQDFLRQNTPVEHMNIKELAGYIGKLSGGGATASLRPMLVDLYQKTSFPFTSFIIILLGIPTSIVIRRRAVAFSSIGLCLVISFLFYVLYAVSIALGKAGILPPFIAAWMSHICFGAVAIYLISKLP